MIFSIDFVFYRNGRINVRGWAAEKDRRGSITAELVKKNGETVPASVVYESRQDVLLHLYQEGGTEEPAFSLTAYADTKENILLKVSLREDPAVSELIDIRRIYRSRYSLKSFLKSKDRDTFLREKKYGDLQSDDFYYQKWYEEHKITPAELKKQRKERFSYAPRISILVPVYKPEKGQFDAMLDSVRKQSYENFELCLANGTPEDRELSAYLDRIAKKDPRIRVRHLEKNLGIAGNTNACLDMASGEWCMLLDQDDLYEPDALFEFVRKMNEFPDAEMMYSDEDKIDNETGGHLMPHFKPDFSPARLHSDNYICHLLAAKTELLKKAGGERPGFDGAQDYDLVLRLTENTRGPVIHIPKILYNWRVSRTSTSADFGAKSYAIDAGRRALQEAYTREGLEVRITDTDHPGRYVTTPVLKSGPLVSILIPNKDHREDLKRCVESILEKAAYKNFEILVIENNSTEEETFSFYKALEACDPRIRVLYYPDAFNYSKINNFGAKEAKGEYLLLLNNDTEVISENFIESLLFYAMMPDVGAAGAKLLYGDDTIQHAGVTVGVEGRVIHMYAGVPEKDPGYMGRLITSCDVSAVTGACLMTKKSLWEELSGLDEAFAVAYNDVDYCLRLQKMGLRVVYDAFAKLHHYESKSRGYEDTEEKQKRLEKEMDLLKERWPERMARDPYYNDNLSLTRGFYQLP